jgi:hypothetical protein
VCYYITRFIAVAKFAGSGKAGLCMNKRWKIMLSAAVVMCLAVACGDSMETTTAGSESTISESSSGEILMDGLEYLLSDDKEDVIQIPDTEEEQDPETQESAEGQPQETVSENAVEDTVELVLYYSNGRFDSLDSEKVEAEQLTPDSLISMLSMHNIVSLDTKVLSFEEEEMVGGSILHLDLSHEIEDYLCTMTREAESIIIASVTDTFLENYGADAIYITVEGEPLSTPYTVYEDSLKMCMPQDLMETSAED